MFFLAFAVGFDLVLFGLKKRDFLQDGKRKSRSNPMVQAANIFAMSSLVIPPGFEPESSEPESDILSVELRDRFRVMNDE